MNTEELKSLGLTEEQIKGVMAAHGKVVNPLKEQVNTLTSERDSAKEQLTTVSGQLDTLQKNHKSDKDLQAELEKAKQENAEAQKKAAEQLNQVRLDSATKLALTQAGALNVKAVEALLDKDSLKLDDKGKLNGLDEQLKTLQSADDSKMLFKAAAPTEPTKPNTPKITTPGNPDPNPTGDTTIVDKIAARLSDK
ncbi:phage scaffolding protein [Lacticaseibacillus hegangensis]|uniref:Phage scaffolding protein n=1 Tax=Lacticaseibacillus hegangensis TaxID=2486010 RepID=A0ABW4CYN8_9LACO|nr:phage scaffolding protein [Lacticaseibacillus hegangensis]